MDEPTVLIVGSVETGFTFHGPFSSLREADAYGYEYYGDQFHSLQPLHRPKEEVTSDE